MDCPNHPVHKTSHLCYFCGTAPAIYVAYVPRRWRHLTKRDAVQTCFAHRNTFNRSLLKES